MLFIPIYIPSSILNSHLPPYLTLLGPLIPFNVSLYSSVFYRPSLGSLAPCLHVLLHHPLHSPGSATAAQVDRALSSNVQSSLGSRPQHPNSFGLSSTSLDAFPCITHFQDFPAWMMFLKYRSEKKSPAFVTHPSFSWSYRAQFHICHLIHCTSYFPDKSNLGTKGRRGWGRRRNIIKICYMEFLENNNSFFKVSIFF